MFAHGTGATIIEIVDFRQRNAKEDERIENIDQFNMWVTGIGVLAYYVWWIVA
jgi:hypothetical protein